MARKKIREYDSKRLLKQALQESHGWELPLKSIQVKPQTDFLEVLEQNPWLKSTKLVVKPDMLFGQRGKHNLVGLDLTFQEAEAFIQERMGKIVEVKGCRGAVNTFLIEPFVPHDQEFYLSYSSMRLVNVIRFSEAGGVDIEENWDRVKTLEVQGLTEVTLDLLAPLVSTLPLEIRPKMAEFIKACYDVFEDLNFSFMEMNPFTLDKNGDPFPLDMRGELDDTAAFKSGKRWGDVEFPLPFGRTLSAAERYIYQLDEATGASLKLTVLNPRGRIWTMVAGGGASVIYADTVADLGYASELGNYGEYSGGPNTQEVYSYAKTLLDLATAGADGRGRALLIGGGIANFTDVAITFRGIIMAIKEKAEDMKACGMHIFVRRGGPNYEAGLKAMRDMGTETGLPVEVYGPETSMTSICQKSIQYLQQFAEAK